MSLTCSAALEGLASGLKEPECEPSRSAKSNLSAKQSLESIGQECQSLRTLENSPLQTSRNQLTLFAEGSLVSHLAQPAPGNEKAQSMTITSGLKCSELFKSSSPLGSVVKMLLASSQWHSNRWYLTWKPANTKLHHRLKFRLVASDTITGGRASGFLHTPTRAANQAAPSMQKHPSCRGAIVTPDEWCRRMGFPKNWAHSEHTEMPLSRKSRKSSGGQS